MDAHPSSTICVECFSDRSGWKILRSRLTKNRSNSARTIMDTLWIDTEAISLVDIRRSLDRRVDEVCLPVLDGVCGSLAWMGYTWAHASDICELELRLVHDGSCSIPAAMFHRIVKRLQMNTSMVASEINSLDSTDGSVRVTIIGDMSYSIRKERGFQTDLDIPSLSPLGMQCALSYEHPTTASSADVSTYCTTRRQKRRWRFVHREMVAIDCTYVQTTDYRDMSVKSPALESYEIEIELLRNVRYNNIPYTQCSGLILSMVWRMLLYILDKPVETTEIREF
jgi:hypothetical protein